MMGRQDERKANRRGPVALPRDVFNAAHWRTSIASGYFTTFFFGANDSSNVAHARSICHRGGDVIKISAGSAVQSEAIIKLKKIIVRHLHAACAQKWIYRAACGAILCARRF